jgi:FkbM family methyltransferase
MPDFREMSFIKDYLRAGDRFIDVGANVGLYSLLARSLVGATGRIDAFEPVPRTADRLDEALRINGLDNVHLHRVAASETTGTVSFDHTADSCTAHVAASTQPGGEASEVPTVRLDEYLPRDDYAMAKFDIEGYEPFALRGMRGLLASGNPPVMQVELAGYSKRYGVTSTDFIRDLKDLGYDTGYYVPETRSIVFTETPWDVPVDNVLAVCRERLSRVLDRLKRADRTK